MSTKTGLEKLFTKFAKYKSTAVLAPFVHMNGTSRKSLIQDYGKAMYALQDALQVLQRSAPNGRDYYNHPNGTLKQAQQEHFDRIKKIQDVIDELQNILEQLDK